MFRAVLDTNVFISGGTISTSPPSQIIDHWRNQDFVMVVSPQLIAEYEEVLQRPAIMRLTGLSAKENRKYIEEITRRAYLTSEILTLAVLQNDPDDNMVLACAEEGLATHIVTGNKKHFPFTEYKGIQILTPREFLTLLDS